MKIKSIIKNDFIKFKMKIELKRSENNKLWKPLIILKDICRKFMVKFIIGKYRIHFVKDKKAIYFVMPKVASGSLGIIFETEMINLKENELRKYKDYFKFTFVRNPYKKILSCYLDKIKGKDGFLNGMWIDFWKFKGKFYPNMSFKEFVRSVHSIPDYKSDTHFKSQYCFVFDKKGSMIPDFIGKLESFGKDYKKICERIEGGFNEQLIHFHRSASPNLNFDDYYDEETKKLVQERYKEDFKLFSYNK